MLLIRNLFFSLSLISQKNSLLLPGFALALLWRISGNMLGHAIEELWISQKSSVCRGMTGTQIFTGCPLKSNQFYTAVTLWTHTYTHPQLPIISERPIFFVLHLERAFPLTWWLPTLIFHFFFCSYRLIPRRLLQVSLISHHRILNICLYRVITPLYG